MEFQTGRCETGRQLKMNARRQGLRFLPCFYACLLFSGITWATGQTSPGEVVSELKFSAASLPIGFDNRFGSAVEGLGDLDGDGFEDVAVGAPHTANNPTGPGSIWILFLNDDGSLKSHKEIVSVDPNAEDGDRWGIAIEYLGDIDGDATTLELAVGAVGDKDGGVNAVGAVWILSILKDDSGTVLNKKKISSTSGGFPANELEDGDKFGTAIASLGDLDGDGTLELAIGANHDDGAGGDNADRGAVWIVSIDTSELSTGNPCITDAFRLTDTSGSCLEGELEDDDQLGISACAVGDLDSNGTVDLAVGAYLDDDAGSNRGAVYVLFLDSSKSLIDCQKLSATTGGFCDPLDDDDNFGFSVAYLDQLTCDDAIYLAVGSSSDSDAGPQRGAVWILELSTTAGSEGTVLSCLKISDTTGGFGGGLADGDAFGSSVSAVGDINGDGVRDICVGAQGDADVVILGGAVWMLYLNGSEWTTLGSGCAGTSGDITYTSEGSLVVGSTVTKSLFNAPPLAQSFLVIGFLQIDAAVRCCTLVPSPQVLIPVTVDGFGNAVLSGPWPPGIPACTTYYSQWWVLDDGGCHEKWGVSNAMAGRTP